MFKFPAGCPQGSTLGPKVFNIYCNDLHEVVDGHLISYADDSYVVLSSSNVSSLVQRSEEVIQKHLEWLSSNGMVCNTDKTEVMLLGSDGADEIEIRVGQNHVKSSQSLKVLGIMFDRTLSWNVQVSSAISKSNRMFHGLKGLKKLLNPDQMRQAVTAFYFSTLYHGMEVWFHRGLSFRLNSEQPITVPSDSSTALKRLEKNWMDLVKERHLMRFLITCWRKW